MEDDLGFDLDAAVNEIGGGLGVGITHKDQDDVVLDVEGTGVLPAEGTAPTTPAAAASPSPAPAAPAAPGVTSPAPSPDDPLAAPPKTWRKEAHAHWATLPVEVKQEIARREEDMFRGIEGYRTDADRGKRFAQMLQPYEPLMKQHNLDPIGQVQSLLNAHHTLATGSAQQKVELLTTIARQYGVDPVQLSGGEAPFMDPQVQTLQTQLQQLQSQLSATQSVQQQQQLQEHTAAVNAFAADPAHVYFEEVGHDMANLLQKGVAKDLKHAYEMAVWANPVTRAKEQTRLATEKASQDAAAAAEKAAAAKRATAARVRTTAKSGSAAAPVGSMDDTLNEAFDRIVSKS